MITISALRSVPEFARGQVRDLRPRWALEEAGLPYRVRLLEPGEQDQPEYRALQPFGQVPILEDQGRVLFESGAIVLHIAARSEALWPPGDDARARATQWVFAALNSVEPSLVNFFQTSRVFHHEQWAQLRRPGALAFAQRRLRGLANSLGDKPYLDGDRFTVGDLMMATVLRIVDRATLVDADARLAQYLERCTARPAFQRALAAQLSDLKVAA